MNNNQLTLTVTITLEGDIPISQVRQIIHLQGWAIEDAIADIISNRLDANKVEGDWELNVEIEEPAS